MQDEWTGRPLVEYYIITGVGKQLVPQRSGLARTQQPTRQSSLDEAQNVSPRLRPFPQSDERFVPSVVARYPELDRPTTPFPRDCPDFCFPDGIRLVTLEEHQRDPMPVTNSFVLTTADHTRVYCVSITWMDALEPAVVSTYLQAEAAAAAAAGADATDAAAPATVAPPLAAQVFAQIGCCLISRVPAFELLAQCCRQLYRLHITHAAVPLRRELVQPALSARVAPPGEPTTLCLGGLVLEGPTSRLLDLPRSLATPSDWLLVTKCLDAHNLIAVWALLLAEQKVLCLSAHTHVLTMACETLSGLLFPLKWEHVYVPVLPSRLASFLQAPVPFLVGATPDVIDSSTDEIPSDVVQVHLDNNTVILDQALWESLRLPPRARRKLLRKLAPLCRAPGGVLRNESIDEGADGAAGGGSDGGVAPAADDAAVPGAGALPLRTAGVHGRLVSAFHLPPAPDETHGGDHGASEYGGYDSDGTEASEGGAELAPAAAAQLVKASFLRFFTSLLAALPELYVMPPASVSGARCSALDFFDEEKLLLSVPEYCREWVAMVTRSQSFTEFLHARLTSDGARIDIAFFNESVDAKRNRSRRAYFSKRATPLLTTGAMPSGYRGRMPPYPVRQMYERLCAAPGRARPASSTRVAVLVVAAAPRAGERGRKYAATCAAFDEGLRREFERELLWTRLSDATNGLVLHSVVWLSPGAAHADALAGAAGAAAAGAGGGLEESRLREGLFDLEAMTPARSPARARVRTAVLSGLAQLAQTAGEGAPLCVLALGVGGLVAVELLAEIQAGAAQAGATLGEGALATSLQRCETLAMVATLGVPFGLRQGGATRELDLRVPAPHAVARWTNLRGSWLHFHHRDDALAAPVRPLCAARALRDIECRGRPSKRSADAHSAMLYLHAEVREVVQPIAKALSIVWQDTKIMHTVAHAASSSVVSVAAAAPGEGGAHGEGDDTALQVYR